MKCALTGDLNLKSLAATVAVLFVYILGTDYVIHQVILKSTYMASPQAWRAPEDMAANMCWMFLGQLLIAKFFVVLFAKGYQGTGVMEGLRFGLLIGLFSAGGAFIQYAVFPIPMCLMWSWAGLGLAQALGGGAIASLVYKKKI